MVIEEEFGWLNCYITGKEAYLENMHIYEHFRKQQKGTSMLSNLEMSLKEIHGCDILVASISRSLLNGRADTNLQMALRRGFKFLSSTNDIIVLKKEL